MHMKKLLGNKKVSYCALAAIIATMSVVAPGQIFADTNDISGANKLQQSQQWVISDIFEEENIAREVSKLLNKDINDTTTYEELQTIRVLSIDMLEIKSLEGLQYLDNLEILNAVSNEISDLTPISNLEKLRITRLFGNHISDLTPLGNENLKSLMHVYLAGNNISDPSPLAKLPNLKTVSLYNNCISDLSAFEGKEVSINAINQRIYLDEVGVGEATDIKIAGQAGERINIALYNDGTYKDGKLTWNSTGENMLEFATTGGRYFYGTITQNVLENWKSGTLQNPVNYIKGDRIIHNGKKYVVNITHSNYGDMNWAPGVALNLFTEVQ